MNLLLSILGIVGKIFPALFKIGLGFFSQQLETPAITEKTDVQEGAIQSISDNDIINEFGLRDRNKD
ncbi:MAG: hypothetical protein KAS32_24525 [Candidatus Peribacteraceae bacterium]|nr:hypothetical protein [Candidatus Peribacteraceae bacterium]